MKKVNLLSIILIVLIVLEVGVVSIIIGSKSNKTGAEKAPETIENHGPVDLQNEIVLGEGLRLVGLKEVVGNFPEDGSDEFVESMLAATFAYEGEKTIQYSSVIVSIGEEQYTFEFSTVPSNSQICVFEKDRKTVSEMSEKISAEAEYIAYFDEEPTVKEDELEVTLADGAIKVKNLSSETIDHEISIFYKTTSGDMYLGGITYRLRIPSGLQAGEEVSVVANHVSENQTKVMFVTYDEG